MIVTAEFIESIHLLVKNHKMSYMDAIITHCERKNIEIEAAAPLIKNNAKIKALLQEEAENLNYLEKTTRLPL